MLEKYIHIIKAIPQGKSLAFIFSELKQQGYSNTWQGFLREYGYLKGENLI